MKTCVTCNLTFPLSSFYIQRKEGKEYKMSSCIPCTRIYNRSKYNPLRNYKSYIIREFGITFEDYLRLYEVQKGVCAICSTELTHAGQPGYKNRWKRACLDHNHKTKEIRGLLCSHCNTGLGQFKDSINFLQKAIEYLDARTKKGGVK